MTRRTVQRARDDLPFRERLPVKDRAGTVLDHRYTEAVWMGIAGDISQHGLIDHSKRLYQCGGRWFKFFYRKGHLISLPKSVWEEVKDVAALLEVIDHDMNDAWTISRDDFALHLEEYDEGIGKRVGVSPQFWVRNPGPVRPTGEWEPIKGPDEPPSDMQGTLF